MMNPDYRVEALAVLLNGDCLMERYAPLIAYKEQLIKRLQALGCRVKSDVQKLPDEALMQAGLPDEGTVRLFRRFLTIYDVKAQKLREIDTICAEPEKRAALRELVCLPGVRQVRAELYWRAGFRSLEDLANAAEEEILHRTARTIAEQQLPCAAPLPKEVRTHIAVAKAFTQK